MSEEGSNNVKVTYTPGWNDPPVFAYDSHQSQTKGYSLNKRVAYPEDNNHQKDNCPNVPDKPPQIGPPRVPLLDSKPEKVDNKDVASNKPIELSNILDNFNTTLKELYTDDKEKEYCEIKRRLAIMEKMWNDNKFPDSMKQKLYDISGALQENKVDLCDSLQRQLMVDHTSLCSTWMAAIRLLINSKRSSNQ